MNSLLRAFLIVALGGSASYGTVLYTFQLDSIPAGEESIQPATFTITSPTYLMEGPFNPGPFTVTIGNQSIAITQGYASGLAGFVCFTFGSADAMVGPCTAVSNGTGLAFGGEFAPASFPGPLPPPAVGLPTAPGMYLALAPVIEYGSTRTVADMTLTVANSTVPEPNAFASLLVALLVLARTRAHADRRP